MRSDVGKTAGEGPGCAILFALPFAGGGILAAARAVGELRHGDGGDAAFLGIFALAFGGVGFGLLFAALYGGRTLREARAREESAPDEPWRWREDWATGRIVSASHSDAGFAWVFALLWNLISSYPLFLIPEELREGDPAVLIALLFPLVGIGLVVSAVRKTLRWRRFGVSTFRMKETPAAIGGQLRGLITSQRPLADAGSIKLRLACLRHERRGRSSSERLIWEDEKTLTAGAVRATGGIPVVFDIPADCEPASASRLSSSSIRWMLQATAEMPGVDYAAEFDVPVFRAAVTPAAASTDDPTGRWQKDGGEYRPDGSSGIRVLATPQGGTELIFPAARHPRVGVVVLLFAVFFTGALGLMTAGQAPLIFLIAFGLGDLVLIAMLVELWLGSTRVVVDERGLTVHRRWVFVKRALSFTTGEITGVEPEAGMVAGNRTYYDLKVSTSTGRQGTARTMIRHRREAEWLAGQLRSALKLER